MSTATRIALAAGPLAGLALGGAIAADGGAAAAAWTAGVTALCALWWIFEPIPIPATSLLPLAIFPLVGVLEPSAVGAAYGSPLILLLLGGFLLSTAMERCGVHRRIALAMVRGIGTSSGRRLVFGFSIAAAALSLWISNTATTLMLLPVAIATLQQCEDEALGVPLLLGIAYGASIGGMGTPVGSPPNLIFMQIYGEAVGSEPTFLEWMRWGIPVVLVMAPIAALWLGRSLGGPTRVTIPDCGPWRPEERRTLILFGITALLWVTRREPFGGWSGALDLPGANDASVALLAVVGAFVIPNGKAPGERLLDWETAVRIPWGVLILFGGGIAIAKAFGASGLSETLGAQLSMLAGWPTYLMLLGICLSVTFLTEMTSNTATTSLLMPLLATAGLAAGVDPALFMVPAALSASCAFMLPVATAPNAVVFGSERIPIARMAREGFALNLIGAFVIASICAWRLA